jgi:hypothetical protein
MNDTPQPGITRKQIAIRLAYTIFFAIVLGLAKMVIVFITIAQFIYLLITLKHVEPARVFANRVIAYSYRLMRYMTLNENARPFPFQELPPEIDPPEAEISFDQ